MEDIHRNHKETAWGWVALLTALLDGFPRQRQRQRRSRTRRGRPAMRVVPS